MRNEPNRSTFSLGTVKSFWSLPESFGCPFPGNEGLPSSLHPWDVPRLPAQGSCTSRGTSWNLLVCGHQNADGFPWMPPSRSFRLSFPLASSLTNQRVGHRSTWKTTSAIGSRVAACELRQLVEILLSANCFHHYFPCGVLATVHILLVMNHIPCKFPSRSRNENCPAASDESNCWFIISVGKIYC